MSKLFIRGNRNGYAPNQCGRTFTVGELIEFLSDFDENLPVYLNNDSGYTYIWTRRIMEQRSIIQLSSAKQITNV